MIRLLAINFYICEPLLPVMKRLTVFLLFIIGGVIAFGGTLQQKLDKKAFYAAMSSGNVDEVNAELEVLNSATFTNKQGYEGALLMRKAGMVARPAEKLKLFKAGRIKFDGAILNDGDNVEFHFLRFAIQEHAPKIVKYRTDLETDKQVILKNYKSLPPVVQQAIIDYTKNSKLLNPRELN